MTDWIVRRWARYGHERLYAETPGGTALGYLDLRTGRHHSDDLSNLPLLEKAIGDHLAAQQVAVQPALTQVVEPDLATAAEIVAAVVEEQPSAEVPVAAGWVTSVVPVLAVPLVSRQTRPARRRESSRGSWLARST